METLMKKRWFKPVAALLLIVVIALLMYAYTVDGRTYMTLRDDALCELPFENVYFGMTVDEFCEAVQIDKSELKAAEPIDSARYFDLKEEAVVYGCTEDDLRIYDKFENQYYFFYGEPLYGSARYFTDDRPGSVRLIFTNETTYKNKTVPPLLCAVFIDYSLEEDFNLIQKKSNYAQNSGKRNLNQKSTHERALLLSYLYASGASPEEIEKLDVPHMSIDEANRQLSRIFNRSPMAIYPPEMRIHASFLFNSIQTEKISQYVVADAPYLAYYDWFLNELT